MTGITLVTGAAGFVGSHLVDALTERDTALVLGTDIRHSPWTNSIVDVRDPQSLARLPWDQITTCYHLASVVGVPNYLSDPLAVIETVIDGTRNVARLCDAYGVTMVHASTSEVYGRNPALPWREDSDRVLGSTETDRWSYASAKGTAEHMLIAMRRQGLRVTIARFFNVYGPRQAPIFAVSALVHAVLNGVSPKLHYPGSQTRCFTYVSDAVAGLMAIRGGDTTYNIGSEVETSIDDLARAIRLEAWRFPAITRTHNPYQDDIARRQPDTTRIRTLGWRPEVDLRDGLARTVAWARENPEWLGVTKEAA